ncbi:Gldg family protein [Butyricimonas synergistica]|uniref:Gldg family protein n=1 Tax=Butyricimonas synergistica TaxID=544644 RepID=UPI00039E82EE|nr:DUF4350 domain-containing protein [Butyricimonas synergistica]
MRTIMRIMKTELRVMFFSPIAWMVLIVFAFQAGLTYCDEMSDQLRHLAMGYRPYNVTVALFGYRGVLAEMLNNLYLYIPLLTMGLMSRELSSGSIKLLYSSPVSNFQIVMGKYFSVVVYGVMLIFILLIPVVFTIFTIKDPDIPLMFTALLGVFITICAYAAIGLFMSTITKYQVVAAIGTLAILAVLNFIGGVGQDIDFVRDITYWLSISGRSRIFLEGMICSRDILYFILVIFMFLAFTFIKLQGERLKRSVVTTSISYLLVLAFVLLAGYGSSRPAMIAYYDVTATKVNTLTPNSQEIMKKLDGGLTLTTYVNLLDDTWYNGSPGSKNYDMKRFERYVRFKPEMKIEYVYYYGKGTSPHYDKVYKDLSTEERFLKVCEGSDYNPKMFISAEEVNKTEDISAENGRFVRVFKRDNGQKAYLRIYNDQYVHPFESEITAALKTLVGKSPRIAFVTGHGERGCGDYGDRGYAAFAKNPAFRNALINQGYQVQELTLDKPVPENVDVVVISDMKSSFTSEEFENYRSFVDRGGNLIILGESRRQAFMNPLVEELGLRFSDGILVAPSKQYLADIIAANIMEGALNVSPYFANMIKRNNTVITPSACAVQVIDSMKGFTISEVLATRPQGSWIEYETTDFLNETVTINPNKGEVEQSNSVMLYLTRDIADKQQQRIFVIGDSDCLSTKELSTSRAGLNGANFELITEMFRCLSYGEYPIETSRVRPPDDNVYLSQNSLIWLQLLFICLIPLGIMVWGITFLIRRKRN